MEKENKENSKASVFEMTKDLVEPEGNNEDDKGVDWGWGDEDNTKDDAQVTHGDSAASADGESDVDDVDEMWETQVRSAPGDASTTTSRAQNGGVAPSLTDAQSMTSTDENKTEHIAGTMLLHPSSGEDIDRNVDKVLDVGIDHKAYDEAFLSKMDTTSHPSSEMNKHDNVPSSPTKNNTSIDIIPTSPSTTRRSTRARRKPEHLLDAEEDSLSKTKSNVKKVTQPAFKGGDPVADDEAEPPSVPQKIAKAVGQQPLEEDLLRSTDFLFLDANKDTVTVADICRALCAEYGCKLSKDNKRRVREHLIDLMNGTVVPQVANMAEPQEDQNSLPGVTNSETSDPEQDTDDDDRSEVTRLKRSKNAKSKPKIQPKWENARMDTNTYGRDEEDVHEEDQVSEQGDVESEQSDFEQASDTDEEGEAHKTRSPKKATSNTSTKVTKAKPPDKRKAAKAAKAARMIETERLRKKRIEELRIRNEEMQLNQSKEDQARAEAIAAKFETNTDELRLKRLEDRLTLLELLDKKRIAVIDALESQIEAKNAAAEASLQERIESVTEVNDEIEAASSDEEAESSEEEEELDIVGMSKPFKPLKLIHTHLPCQALTILRNVNSSPVKKIEAPQPAESNFFLSPTPLFKASLASPTRAICTRDKLREALKHKQRKQGNLWLARELGYKTEEEHLKDCQQVAEEKRTLVRKMEKARIEANDRRLLRDRILRQEEGFLPEQDEGEDGGDESTDNDDEEDEEMQMARELEQNDVQKHNDQTENVQAPPTEPIGTDCSHIHNDLSRDIPDNTEVKKIFGEVDIHPQVAPDEEDFQQETQDSNNKDSTISASCNDINIIENAVSELVGPDADNETETINLESTSEGTNDVSNCDDDDGEQEFEEDDPKKDPNRPRNAAWQAMLKKEAEMLKKQKSKRKQGLVEDQAEEEEEEEVAGLEDFGFTIKKKKQDDDDDEEQDDKLDEEDLKHVVDDVSDNEGDEEAGEVARKRQERLEEKEQHKEIMRRMREGYDGRRGGIAGGGVGARGIHRFDQLVAADNREDAKRLGLLNDDELDSDDDGEKMENKGGDDNEDDEAVLLDKMLKDRFLHRTNVDLDENFSDDEEESERVDDQEAGEDSEAEEERTQERLAKRFAKRARMQRLEEEFADSQEFSRQRLIDEDETMRQELSRMKNGLVRKRSVSSSQSTRNSVSSQDSSTAANKKTRVLTTGGSLFEKSGTSLSIALRASRQTQHRTTFLGGEKAGKAKESGALIHKSVALGHVVFASANRGNASNAGSNVGEKRKRVIPGPAGSSLFQKVARKAQ